MAGSAHVQSLHDLAEFRAFLVTLAEQINLGLQAAAGDADATAHWLGHTQPARWKARCDKSQRLVQDAVESLRRKRMSPTADGRPPSTLVEQKTLRSAKQQLEHAQLKADAVSRWQRRYEKQMHEFRRATQSARTLVDQVIPQAVAYLDHLGRHLEQYAQAAFPAAPVEPGKSPESAPSVAPPMPDVFFQAVADPDDRAEAGA